MDAATRSVVTLVLSALLTLIGACPVTGCATDATGRYVGVGTGGSLGNVGPGADVRVTNLDGMAGYAIAGVAAVATAVAAYALWKHEPKLAGQPPIGGKEP